MQSEIPGIRTEIETTLAWMLQELIDHRLESCTLPSKFGSGRRYRVLVSCNCEWYQELCRRHEYPRKRYPKPRTIIRRRETIAALKRMIRGNYTGVYADRIFDVLDSLTQSNL